MPSHKEILSTESDKGGMQRIPPLLFFDGSGFYTQGLLKGRDPLRATF